jgi:hypothetical protein
MMRHGLQVAGQRADVHVIVLRLPTSRTLYRQQ